MLIRYRKNAQGLDAVAKVYGSDENGIDIGKIDANAVSVIRKLTEAGYESYIVGGAVRDLILGRTPKDFDIATVASPRQVHKLFRNSRIIGRRFRLVHITFGPKIIEVSTFRSIRDHEAADDNQFGTIEEDCTRRDFTINSLYYDPLKGNLIDFNNALEDFKKKRLVSLIPLGKTFIEDPVRMVRAVKYSVTTGFRIPYKLSHAIRVYAPELSGISTSRMTEEVNKILACGMSSAVFRRLHDYKLLVYMLPAISVYASYPQLFESLGKLDEKVAQGKDSSQPVSKAEMYLGLARPFLAVNADLHDPMMLFYDFLRQIKVLISPITPSNYDLETASAQFMSEQGMKVPRGAVKHRNPDLPQPRPQHPQHGTKPGEKPAGKRHRKHHTKKKPQDQA